LTRIDLFCYVLPGALFGAFATFKNKSLMGQAIESIGSTPSLSAKTIKKLAERLAFLLLKRWKSLLLHWKKAKR